MKLVLWRKKKDGTYYPAWVFILDPKVERLEIDGKAV